MNELSNLKPPKGAVKGYKRLGRGAGSGLGKTSGKGQKGQLARSGGFHDPGFEGGQMRLARRLPKRGFSNAVARQTYQPVNVDDLMRFEDGATVDLESLKELGLVKGHTTRVKITGDGELSRRLIIKADRISQKGSRPERSKTERRTEVLIVSQAAAEKIKSAGGQVEVK